MARRRRRGKGNSGGAEEQRDPASKGDLPDEKISGFTPVDFESSHHNSGHVSDCTQNESPKTWSSLLTPANNKTPHPVIVETEVTIRTPLSKESFENFSILMEGPPLEKNDSLPSAPMSSQNGKASDSLELEGLIPGMVVKQKTRRRKRKGKSENIESSAPGSEDRQSKDSQAHIPSPPSTKQLIRCGLKNRGNTCYMNSVLQALFSVPVFESAMQCLEKVELPRPICPVLTAFSEMMECFKGGWEAVMARWIAQAKDGEWTPDYLRDKHFPFMFFRFLTEFDPDMSPQNAFRKQQDAQEFLSFLLDKLHNECRILAEEVGVADHASENSVQVDVWQQKRSGGKGSASVTNLKLQESPISKTFVCQLKHITKDGGKILSSSTQPYYVIHLDIRNCQTVQSAFDDQLSIAEQVEGFATARSGVRARVSQRTQLDSLPRVIILHLKRYLFSDYTGAAIKISSPCSFGPTLTVTPQVTSHSQSGIYSLVSVVSHLGATAKSGHYTCASRLQDGSWMHYDDFESFPIRPEGVWAMPAYLLVYSRVM